MTQAEEKSIHALEEKLEAKFNELRAETANVAYNLEKSLIEIRRHVYETVEGSKLDPVI